MKYFRRQSLVWAGALGLGLASLHTLPAFAAKGVTAAVRASDETVAYDAAPNKVRAEVDRLRGKDKVLSTEHVTYPGGRQVYRVTVNSKNGVRILRVSPGGSMLSIEDIRPTELTTYRKDPAAFHAQHETVTMARESAYATEAETVTATPENPEKIAWNRLPARVRATFLRESAGEPIDYIIRYRDNQRNVIYQANVPVADRKVQMVQVLSSGAIFNEASFNTSGGAINENNRVRTIGLNEVPPAVMNTVDRAAPNGRIPLVEVANRHGREVYTMEVQQGSGSRFLTIDANGKILADDAER